jgi:hypothetical protein
MTPSQATSRTNEAAERLRAILSNTMSASIQESNLAALDAALSEERRLTATAIRQRIESLDHDYQNDHVVLRWIDISPIFDELESGR